MKIEEIGRVKNDLDEPESPDYMRKHQSVIEVKPAYVDGLEKIESNDYLQILFYLHLSDDYELIGTRRGGDPKGVFASRSPHRPTPVGSTVVKLLSRSENSLMVEGLDAVNGTPVIDIKPYAPPFDTSPLKEELKSSPRMVINRLSEREDLEGLFLKAGELHGHFCPYLALGVIAAQHALMEIGNFDAGMEELLAIVETNSCFSDGIQYVTETMG